MVCSIGIFSKRIDGEQVQKIILAWAAENEENRLQHHYRPGTYTTRTAHTHKDQMLAIMECDTLLFYRNISLVYDA